MSYTAVFFPLSIRLKDVSDAFLLDPAVLPRDLEKPVGQLEVDCLCRDECEYLFHVAVVLLTLL